MVVHSGFEPIAWKAPFAESLPSSRGRAERLADRSASQPRFGRSGIGRIFSAHSPPVSPALQQRGANAEGPWCFLLVFFRLPSRGMMAQSSKTSTFLHSGLLVSIGFSSEQYRLDNRDDKSPGSSTRLKRKRNIFGKVQLVVKIQSEVDHGQPHSPMTPLESLVILMCHLKTSEPVLAASSQLGLSFSPGMCFVASCKSCHHPTGLIFSVFPQRTQRFHYGKPG